MSLKVRSPIADKSFNKMVKRIAKYRKKRGEKFTASDRMALYYIYSMIRLRAG